MRRVMRTWSSFFAGTLLVLLSVSACITPSHPSKPEPSGSSTGGASTDLRGIIVARLSNNRLLAVRAPDGKVVAALALAPPPSQMTGAGHYLAVSPDDKLLYVLTSPLTTTKRRIVLVNSPTPRVRQSLLCHERHLVLRSPCEDPKSGLP